MVSLLIDTNRSSGPASFDAWLKLLNGAGAISPIPSRTTPLTDCKSKISGKP
jgi:hypothetical protein